MTKRLFSLVMITASLVLAACSNGIQSEAKYPTGIERSRTGNDIYSKGDSIFGEGGLQMFGKDRKGASSDVITVNAYLWRAALDTVNFMPLANVDPFGGVILTDWYTSPEKPGERYKLNIFVMGSQLRSDGIKVSMFKQRNGKDVAVDPKTNTDIEDAILTRARELRIASKSED